MNKDSLSSKPIVDRLRELCVCHDTYEAEGCCFYCDCRLEIERLRNENEALRIQVNQWKNRVIHGE